MSTADRVMSILAEVTGTDLLLQEPDVPLFDRGLLDSFGTVELLVALSEAFDVELSPAEFERDEWATPRKIIAYMENRVGA